VPSLTRQLERLLDDPAVVARYRERARERARRYSWDAVTDQYEDLLRRVCDRARPGALPPELIDAAPAPPRRDSTAAPTAA
jgi:predicted dehydrogenase